VSSMTATRGDTNRYTLTIARLGVRLNFDTEIDQCWFTVKRAHSDSDDDALIQKTVGDGITPADQGEAATEGQAELVLAPADTASVSPTTIYYYDVQILESTVVTTVDSGTFTVSADVTRATS
jgi:hypothetical protein